MGNNARGQWDVASDAEDPAYVNGNWYIFQECNTQASSAIPASSLRLVPFRVRTLANIAQIGLRISTLAASGNIQLGVYAALKDSLPSTGPALMQTPSLGTDTAVPVAGAVVGGPIQIPRGIYWLGLMADATAGGVVIVTAPAAAATYHSTMTGAASQASLHASATNAAWCRSVGVTFGTWPNLTGATTVEATSSAAPVGHFQIAP